MYTSHCSTSRNERLHRELNHILSTNRIGLELAFLRCSRIFFRMNNPSDDSLPSKLCCPSKDTIAETSRVKHFRIPKTVSLQNANSAVLGAGKNGEFKSLKELKADELLLIRNVITQAITSCSALNEHAYSSTDNSIQLIGAFVHFVSRKRMLEIYLKEIFLIHTSK